MKIQAVRVLVEAVRELVEAVRELVEAVRGLRLWYFFAEFVRECM